MEFEKQREEKRREEIISNNEKLSELQNKYFKKQRLDSKSWERFDKLYEHGVHRQKERSKPREDTNTYVPKINKHSHRLKNKRKFNEGTKSSLDLYQRQGKNISDLLYSDALRRQEVAHNRIHSSIGQNQQSFISSNSYVDGGTSGPRTNTTLTKKLSQLNKGT